MQNNDLISRKALGISRCNPDVFNDRAYGEGWNACIALIEAAPAVDAVPVVRCKDCIYYNINYCGDGFGWCERKGIGIGHGTSDDWFCASGEAKEES